MNFIEFATQEVNELVCELTSFLKKYVDKNLNGFTEQQKIIIATSAIGHLLTIIYVKNIKDGIMSFKTIEKYENLMMEFISNEIKNEY